MKERGIDDEPKFMKQLKLNRHLPLIEVIIANNEPVLIWMLEFLEIDVNQYNQEGRTALSWAI